MSGIQNFFKKILPSSLTDSMERESREWMLKCDACGFESSVWERGGIRWKASGNPTRVMPCENCGKNGGHTTYRIEA